MFLLLLVASAYSAIQKEGDSHGWPDTNVIWIQHDAVKRQTHVNNAPTDDLPADILNHYVARGYKLEQHTMAATETSRTGQQTLYSWILVKQPIYC
jgi:hypothetical protein